MNTLNGNEDESLFEEEEHGDDDEENFDKIDETVISLWIIKIKKNKIAFGQWFKLLYTLVSLDHK